MSSVQVGIDICRKEYIKQKKLEEIINNKQLIRPNVKKWQVILLLSALPLLLFGEILFAFILPTEAIFNIFVFVLLLVVTFELYIRLCLLQAVRCYQHYASEETRRKCMCVPSCSEYAIICLRKIFPLILALSRIRIRLYKTCKGEDYKLDFPLKKMNLEFEKKHLN